MNIVIDCRMIDSSGVGMYLSGCLPYLLNSDNQCILLGNYKKLGVYASNYKNTVILDCSIKPFSIFELLFFPSSLRKIINQADMYYSPYFNIPGGISIPVLTTIHDIIFPDIPELTSKIGLLLRMGFYRRAAKKSKKIFTVSEFSKSRIQHYLGNKINVVNASNAVAASEGFPFKGLKKKKIILFIGNIKKHKGLSYLLDAFLSARNDGLDYKLVIIGSGDNFRTSDKSIGARLENLDPESVEFTGFIPELEKERLLMEAALLVQPSLYEGFGYPPLEAMMRGTRVLISDIAVFKEVYREFPVEWFKAGDAIDLKKKLMALLVPGIPKPCVLSEEQLKKYSFKKTVSIIQKELTY